MGGPNYFLPSESAQDMLARFARPAGAFPLLLGTPVVKTFWFFSGIQIVDYLVTILFILLRPSALV